MAARCGSKPGALTAAQMNDLGDHQGTANSATMPALRSRVRVSFPDEPLRTGREAKEVVDPLIDASIDGTVWPAETPGPTGDA